MQLRPHPDKCDLPFGDVVGRLLLLKLDGPDDLHFTILAQAVRHRLCYGGEGTLVG